MNSTYALSGLYAFLGLLIVAVGWGSIRHKPSLALAMFNVSYLLFFVFVPLNVIFIGADAVRQTYVFERFGYGDLVTAISLIACYLLFLAGYFARTSTSCETYTTERAGGYDRLLRITKSMSLAFVALGLVGMTYHVVQAGGLVEAISIAPCIRSGECGGDGRFLFLRQFNYFLATAFMLFWASFFCKDSLCREKSSSDPWLLFLMIVLFVFYALTTNGRREFLYPATMCLGVLALTGNRRPLGYGLLLVAFLAWWSLGLAGSSSFLWAKEFASTQSVTPATEQSVTFGDGLMILIYLKVLYYNTVQGLADSFMHFVAMQHVELWQFGFLRDFTELPLEFLPSRLLGFERPRGFVGDTSEFILGHRLAQGLSGDEPPGLHGYFLINFGYAGMFVLFFLMGIIFKFLHDHLQPIVCSRAVDWLLYIFVFWGLIELLREGSFALLLKSRASWWLAVGLLVLAKRYQSRSDNLSPKKSVN